MPLTAVRRAVGAVVPVFLAAAAHAQPLPPIRLSVSTAGAQGNAASTFLAISRDDRTVLFLSSATNLVAGDTNGAPDLFIRSRDGDGDGILDEPGTVQTIRVSEGMGGQQVTASDLMSPTLSRDGRFVLFATASALVADDTNGEMDVYLRDRDADGDGIFDQAGGVTLTRVSTGNSNAQGVGGAAFPLGLSDDGRYVLFTSAATNLQPRPTTRPQIYRKDRVTSLTVLASSQPDGTPADDFAAGTMSPNGRYVVLSGGFQTFWPFPPAGQPAYPWVLRDLDANGFMPIAAPDVAASVLPAHAAATEAGVISAPAIVPFVNAAIGFSPDGRWVYLSEGTQSIGLVLFTRGTTFEYDLITGRMTRRLPGILAPGTTPFQDQHTFLLTGGANFTPFQEFEGIGSYDRGNGRYTQLVSGPVCSFSATADRVLYRGNTCSASPPLVFLDTRYGTPLPMEPPVLDGRLGSEGQSVIVTSALASILPGGADTNGTDDVFAVDLESRFDRDTDGLDDRWEVAMGLDYTSGAGADGAAGDPDTDGQTNLQEQTTGSHPRGSSRQFLAEGADNAFFKTRLAIANPGTVAATAVVRLDGDDGSTTRVNVHVPAGARRTVFVDEIAGRAPSFSATLESSVPLVSERTMSWDASEYGAHAERASEAPATQWFLAEGATGAFSLFYLLQNPGDTAATATIRYLRPALLAPIDRSYTLPPHSRTTLPVEQQAPELASTDVSAVIQSTQPILVERAMYRSIPGQPFAAGDDSAGVTAPATTWFLAEGATGPFFDLFVLLANPGLTDADVEIRYLLADGTVLTKNYPVAAQSRRTIYVDQETIAGHGQPFLNAAVSCAITSTVPIVAERTMWFPGPEVTPNFWTEANNSPGATAAARRWVLADGEVGGTKATQTYVLIANTSTTPGRARLTVLPDWGVAPAAVSPPTAVTIDLPPNSRTTIPMGSIAGTAERRFGVLVESIDATPLADLVVERAMYWNSGGEVWAAGTNLLATPIP